MIRVPICWDCERAMTCDRNSESIQTESGDIYSGDRYGCEVCSASVVVGFGAKPISGPDQADYEAVRLRLEPVEVTGV